MRSLAMVIALSLSACSGAVASQPGADSPGFDRELCDELHPCGGTGSVLPVGIVVAAVLGASVVIRSLAR